MKTRNRYQLGVIFLLAVNLIGCVLSVDPVISPSDATFDQGLLGNWAEVAGSDGATVSRVGEKQYAIRYTSEMDTIQFEARIGRLGEYMVLDVWPVPDETDLAESYAGLLMPGHLLFTLEIESDEIRVASLERDSVLAALETDRLRLPYTRLDEQLVLLGTTDELRAAFATYLTQTGALSEKTIWKRDED